jgi:hypothetical protein
MFGFFGRRKQEKLEDRWQKARAALAGGEAEVALRVVNKILDEEPDSTEAFLLKTEALRRLGRTEEADQLLRNLSQWADPEVRQRVALAQARVLLERRQWSAAWGVLPRTPPAAARWSWLEAALRCCYEMLRPDEIRRIVRDQPLEPPPEELADPEVRLSASGIQALLGSFYEDELDLHDPASRARVEGHFRRALELWPENEEARRSLDELLAGPAEDEPAPAEEPEKEPAPAEEPEEPAPAEEALPAIELPEEVHQALRLMKEGRFLEAVPFLNRARGREDLLPELFPLLVLAQLYAKDIDGVEFTCGQWEKWIEAGLQTESPQELTLWEAPMARYIELADAIGRLQTFRLKKWIASLTSRGHGGSRCFTMLFQADTELRRLRENDPDRIPRLFHRYVQARRSAQDQDPGNAAAKETEK